MVDEGNSFVELVSHETEIVEKEEVVEVLSPLHTPIENGSASAAEEEDFESSHEIFIDTIIKCEPVSFSKYYDFEFNKIHHSIIIF